MAKKCLLIQMLYAYISLSIYFITLHGFPTATQLSGIERVTTLPAPITLFLPIVTPGKTMLPPPIHAPSQIFIGNAYVLQIPVFISSSFIILSCTFVEWVAVYSCTLEAISTLLPISMILLSTNVQFMLMTT